MARPRPAPRGAPLPELPIVEAGAPPTPVQAFLSGQTASAGVPDRVKLRVTSTQSSFTGSDGSHFTLRAGDSMVVPRHVADAMIAQQLAEEV